LLCSVVSFVIGSSALFWCCTVYFLLNRNICVTSFFVVGTQHLDVKKLLFIILWWCLWRPKLYIDFFMYTVKMLIKFYIRKLSQCNEQTTGWLTILFFPPCPDWQWTYPASIQGYRGTFRGSSSQSVKLAAQLHLLPGLRVCGVMPSLTHTFPLHLITMAVFLTEHRDTFTFYFHNLVHM
jgi:hypothetical protein